MDIVQWDDVDEEEDEWDLDLVGVFMYMYRSDQIQRDSIYQIQRDR
jgi:hypothetical protein